MESVYFANIKCHNYGVRSPNDRRMSGMHLENIFVTRFHPSPPKTPSCTRNQHIESKYFRKQNPPTAKFSVRPHSAYPCVHRMVVCWRGEIARQCKHPNRVKTHHPNFVIGSSPLGARIIQPVTLLSHCYFLWRDWGSYHSSKLFENGGSCRANTQLWIVCSVFWLTILLLFKSEHLYKKMLQKVTQIPPQSQNICQPSRKNENQWVPLIYLGIHHIDLFFPRDFFCLWLGRRNHGLSSAAERLGDRRERNSRGITSWIGSISIPTPSALSNNLLVAAR